MNTGEHKPLVRLHAEIRTPPFSPRARQRIGGLLRLLQRGESLTLPHSRPMPRIGRRCHELRIIDGGNTWRIVYRIDPDAILLLDVFSKKTRQTPQRVIERCEQRIQRYDGYP